MRRLAHEPTAFVRPSPSRGFLGGIAQHTNELILLCEAAGFDHVLVETVGLGQSEVFVDEVVDVVMLIAAPGGGDELQVCHTSLCPCPPIYKPRPQARAGRGVHVCVGTCVRTFLRTACVPPCGARTPLRGMSERPCLRAPVCAPLSRRAVAGPLFVAHARRRA
jgi:hypothetical protein